VVCISLFGQPTDFSPHKHTEKRLTNTTNYPKIENGARTKSYRIHFYPMVPSSKNQRFTQWYQHPKRSENTQDLPNGTGTENDQNVIPKSTKSPIVNTDYRLRQT